MLIGNVKFYFFSIEFNYLQYHVTIQIPLLKFRIWWNPFLAIHNTLNHQFYLHSKSFHSYFANPLNKVCVCECMFVWLCMFVLVWLSLFVFDIWNLLDNFFRSFFGFNLNLSELNDCMLWRTRRMIKCNVRDRSITSQ